MLNMKVGVAELCFQAFDILVNLGGFRLGYQTTPLISLERVYRDLRAARLIYADERLLGAAGRLATVDVLRCNWC